MSDDVGVRQGREHLGRNLVEVGADHQWRDEHGPHADMGSDLLAGEIAVADLQHVRVVPTPGPCVVVEFGLGVDDVGDRTPRGEDVRGGAPQVRDPGRPCPRLMLPVLGDAVDDQAVEAVELVSDGKKAEQMPTSNIPLVNWRCRCGAT